MLVQLVQNGRGEASEILPLQKGVLKEFQPWGREAQNVLRQTITLSYGGSGSGCNKSKIFQSCSSPLPIMMLIFS